MKSLFVLASLLLAAASAQAAGTANLYQCLQGSRHTTLLAVVDAIPAVKALLSNPNTAVTLLAPDNQALAEFIEDWGNGMTAGELLANKAIRELLTKVLLYHLIKNPVPTTQWPAIGTKKRVHTRLNNAPLTLYRDMDGDANVEGWTNDAELNCRAVNLRCGRSIFQSIDEVLEPRIAPFNEEDK